jgi:hypothetical protein
MYPPITLLLLYCISFAGNIQAEVLNKKWVSIAVSEAPGIVAEKGFRAVK